MGKAWSDYMAKNAKREYEESDPIKITDQLRAELARLQRNEDCVQRLIAWAAENGWNGVDDSKILDVFISGLVDKLRAELSAAKDQIATLENQKAAAEYAVAEIWNKNGPHPKSGWMPSGILQGMVERGERVVKESDQLAAHFERMRSALQAIDDLSYSRGVTMEKSHWSLHVPGQSDAIQEVKEVLAATPKQSLSAIKVKTLREVLAVLTGADEPEETAVFLVEDMIERIEKESA